MKFSAELVSRWERTFLRGFALICCFLFAGCLSSGDPFSPAVTLNTRYLDAAALEKVRVTVRSLSYPLTRAETLERLGLTDRNLPSLHSIYGAIASSAHVTTDRELIHLTAPGSRPGDSLLLWYSPAARYLGGDDFVHAKVIIDVELLTGGSIGRLEHPLVSDESAAVAAARLSAFVEKPFGAALAALNLPAEKLKTVKDLLLKRYTAWESALVSVPPGLTVDQREEYVARAEAAVDREIQALVEPAAFEKIQEMALVRAELELIRLNYAPQMSAAGVPLDGPSSVALAKVFKAVFSDVEARQLKNLDVAALRAAKTPEEQARARAPLDESSAYRARDVDREGLSAPDREIVRQAAAFLSAPQLTVLRYKLAEVTTAFRRLEAEAGEKARSSRIR